MAIQSHTVRALVTTTSATDVLVNTNVYDPMYVGQIDVINKSSVSLVATVSILSNGTEYPLLCGTVSANNSRLTDERKIPYALLPGDKVQAKLGAANATGCLIHISYI